ncbi:hypothetical protein FRC08_017922 [Ceratobasidium sp. 394]|nr:hypothetical protein FRC08_017922 [Ceratobasidium sp. 394]
MDAEIPLIIEGHLFTCVQVGTSGRSIVPPKLAGCGCDHFLFPEAQPSLMKQGSTVTQLNKRLCIEFLDSPQLSPQTTFTPPSTPKKNKSSVGPIRTPKHTPRRIPTHSVNSPTFAICMVSPEEAARAAGERRRKRTAFSSPRPQKRARLDDEVQPPKSVKQRLLEQAERMRAAPAMSPVRTRTSTRKLAPILPKQRISEPQVLDALDQVEISPRVCLVHCTSPPA